MLGRLIVRFNTYKTAENHKADLAAALAHADGAWKWIDRQNAASLYPTDFALLEVADAVSENVKVSHTHEVVPDSSMSSAALARNCNNLLLCLQKLLSIWPGVKDVHPEQQVKRSLTWDSNNSDQVKEQRQATIDTEWVQKRPGRYAIPSSHTQYLATINT